MSGWTIPDPRERARTFQAIDPLDVPLRARIRRALRLLRRAFGGRP